jgi:hypothetical protein
LGHRILLDKEIQVTHLKRWTLWNMLKTDVLDRGIPWTELMLREGEMPNDLNVGYAQRISVILTYGLLIMFGVAVWYYRQLIFAPVFWFVLVAFFDYWSTRRHYCTLVRVVAAIAGLGVLAAIGYTFKWWPLLPLALAVGIVAINFRFYYLYCGLAFGLGISLHLWKSRVLPLFGVKVEPRKAMRPPQGMSTPL